MPTMPDIPGKLLRFLRETLANCDEFGSDDQLKDVFVDRRIAPWVMHLRDANNVRTRVNGTISRLIGQERSDTKANVLVLFLYVLKDQYAEQDNRHIQLDYLAKALEPILQSSAPSVSPREPIFQNSAPSVSPRIAEEANPDNQRMMSTAVGLKWSEATKAVSKIS